jgi:hypothetical protein
MAIGFLQVNDAEYGLRVAMTGPAGWVEWDTPL